MIYLKDQEINFSKEQIKDEYKYEFILLIYHNKIISENSSYLFRDLIHENINNFPIQHIILNNINTFRQRNSIIIFGI